MTDLTPTHPDRHTLPRRHADFPIQIPRRPRHIWSKMSPWIKPIIVSLLLVLTLSPWVTADQLMLRNLTRISDITIDDFDEDGVRLSDGRQFDWGQVMRGDVDDDRQADFDELHSGLGMPLYRLRTRLSVRDDHDLSSLAEPLFETYSSRTSPSALLVCIATMRARIAGGDRPSALVPFFESLRILNDLSDLDETRSVLVDCGFAVDLESGICSTYLPVWYDADAAKNSFDAARTKYDELALEMPPGAGLYIATLAAMSGESEAAELILDSVRPATQEILELTEIARLQNRLLQAPDSQTVDFRTNLDKLLPRNQAIALYWLGATGMGSTEVRDQQEAMLDLLRIPAQFGQFEELAAAGLFYVYRGLGELGDEEGQQNILRELLTRYPTSIFAEQIRTGRP